MHERRVRVQHPDARRGLARVRRDPGPAAALLLPRIRLRTPPDLLRRSRGQAASPAPAAPSTACRLLVHRLAAHVTPRLDVRRDLRDGSRPSPRWPGGTGHDRATSHVKHCAAVLRLPHLRLRALPHPLVELHHVRPPAAARHARAPHGQTRVPGPVGREPHRHLPQHRVLRADGSAAGPASRTRAAGTCRRRTGTACPRPARRPPPSCAATSAGPSPSSSRR
jgi:hypothetical protein